MKNKKKVILISSICAIAVIAVAAGAAVFMSRSGKVADEQKAPETTQIPVVTAAPEPTKDPHEGMVRSNLTGEYVTEKVAEKRPYAVIINNIEYANANQQGTSQIDVLYEALAEGGITRMLGVIQNVDKIKKLGSVRSARHYFVSFASEWDAIFCHFGQTKYAISKIEELGINNLSGLSAVGPVVYARDYSYKAPHNVFTTGKKMKKGAKKLGYRTKVKSDNVAEHFAFYEEDTDLDSIDDTTYIKLPFSNYSTCYLKYDTKSKTYKKYEYGKKHKDHKNNKQLAFKNVIVQLVKEKNIDKNGYQHLFLHKRKGEGYYLTNGKRVKITWRKSEADHKMTYYDESGDVLTINPGKTYIAAYPTSRKKLISFKEK